MNPKCYNDAHMRYVFLDMPYLVFVDSKNVDFCYAVIWSSKVLLFGLYVLLVDMLIWTLNALCCPGFLCLMIFIKNLKQFERFDGWSSKRWFENTVDRSKTVCLC